MKPRRPNTELLTAIAELQAARLAGDVQAAIPWAEQIHGLAEMPAQSAGRRLPRAVLVCLATAAIRRLP